MGLTELLDRIARDPDCIVLPATGQPGIDSSHILPVDVRAFYDLCGGLVIGRNLSFEVRIVGPDECVLANDVILTDNILGDLAAVVREELRGNASWDWYIIADVGNGDYLALDCGRSHNGRCYDAFWETYAAPGQMPVVANSLTALIEHLYETKGRHWYWLEPEFQALGDAYDAN